MKHIKKLTAFLMAAGLSVSVLCTSALAAPSDPVYGIIVNTAQDSEDLPLAHSGSSYTEIPSTTFTFPSAQMMIQRNGVWGGMPGYEFLGWKTEGDDTLYQAGDVIEAPQNLTQNVEYYGQWRATHPFTDLEGTWDQLYDMLYCYEQGLMTGTSGNTFSPNGTLTRAMLWTVLGRMDGAEISGSGWMEQAQAWAVENGISDGTFPERAVTRQELATMLYRQAGSPDTYADTLINLNYHPYAGQVADWARDAIWWAINTKVLQCEAAVIDPEGAATRSDVASAVVRFCALTAENGAEAE